MVDKDTIEIGHSIVIQKRVDKKDTADCYGSGCLHYLFATPSLVALMVEASAKLIDRELPEDYVSVGIRLQVSHENPTLLGGMVTVKGVVKEFDGKKVKIELTAFDEIGIIGTCIHDRAIMNNNTLLEKANKRAKLLERGPSGLTL